MCDCLHSYPDILYTFTERTLTKSNLADQLFVIFLTEIWIILEQTDEEIKDFSVKISRLVTLGAR